MKSSILVRVHEIIYEFKYEIICEIMCESHMNSYMIWWYNFVIIKNIVVSEFMDSIWIHIWIHALEFKIMNSYTNLYEVFIYGFGDMKNIVK